MKGQQRAGTPSVKGQENEKGAVKGQIFAGVTAESLTLVCSASTRSCEQQRRSLHRGMANPKKIFSDMPEKAVPKPRLFLENPWTYLNGPLPTLHEANVSLSVDLNGNWDASLGLISSLYSLFTSFYISVTDVSHM